MLLRVYILLTNIKRLIVYELGVLAQFWKKNHTKEKLTKFIKIFLSQNVRNIQIFSIFIYRERSIYELVRIRKYQMYYSQAESAHFGLRTLANFCLEISLHFVLKNLLLKINELYVFL